MSTLAPFAARHEFAAGLMLTGTLVLAATMRLAVGGRLSELHTRLRAFVGTRPFRFWLQLYVLAWLFGTACSIVAPLSGGLQLIFLTMSQTKWAAFILLTFAAFAGGQRSSVWPWIAVFSLEFIFSIGGFFSSFKEVFYFALFGIAAAHRKLSARILIPGVLLGCAMLFLGVIWTAVKDDYRPFVSGGTGQQVVLVDYDNRVEELTRLIGQLDQEDLLVASEDFIQRLMYHTFFAAAANNVPSSIPYAGGAIYGEAISRPFMPRLLFPNKRAIEDSDLTNQYTGLNVAGADEGTSISLGYMAEAYIDFGPIAMFGAIGALGALLGLFYRWLLNQPGSRAAIGAAMAPVALMPAHLAETSMLKMFSSLMLTFLVCVLVLKVLAPMIFRRPTQLRVD